MKKKYHRESIELPESLVNAVDALCLEIGQTRSAWIQDAIASRLGGAYCEGLARLADVLSGTEEGQRGAQPRLRK